MNSRKKENMPKNGVKSSLKSDQKNIVLTIMMSLKNGIPNIQIISLTGIELMQLRV